MARIKNGILGGFSNKVGDVIGQNYAGISTMRAMPKYVSNPQTEAQQNHRKIMKSAAQFFAVAQDALWFSIFNQSPVINGFNNALRKNLAFFDVDANGNPIVSIGDLTMGEYIGVPFFDIRATLESVPAVQNFGVVDLTWDDSVRTPFCHDNDKLVVFVALELGTNQYQLLFGDVVDLSRVSEGGKVIFPLPLEAQAGQNLLFAFGGLSYSDEHVVYKSSRDYPRPGGHNPQKPKEIINIPAKNRVVFTPGSDYVIPIVRS